MTLLQVLFLGVCWFSAGYLVAYLWDRYVRRQQLKAKQRRYSLYRYLAKRHAALNPPKLWRTIDEIQAEQDRQSVERLLASLLTYDPNQDGA